MGDLANPDTLTVLVIEGVYKIFDYFDTLGCDPVVCFKEEADFFGYIFLSFDIVDVMMIFVKPEKPFVNEAED